MIQYSRGNIFTAKVDALVNTVNTVGVMGKGIALQFSREFPEIVRPYQTACASGELTPGRVFTVRLSTLEGPQYVINFPTKQHWRAKSKIEHIEAGLESLVEEIRRLKIRSIAIPPLGCGLGGLRWADVRLRIESALGELEDVEVLVYEPAGTPPAAEMKNRRTKPRMSPGRAALIGLMRRYLEPLLDDSVTLLEVHKLMYFAKEDGRVPNLERLQFSKGKFGPYSTNLRNVLNEIEGHYVTGFGDASEEPGKVLELLPGAAEAADEFLEDQPQTRESFCRVAELIEGFETAFGLELLSSVHWVARHYEPRAETADDAVRQVHEWNPRKRDTFSDAHLRVAWERLTETSWI